MSVTTEADGPVAAPEPRKVQVSAVARHWGVSPPTVNRFINHGVKLPDGTRLKLAAVRVGGKWLTTWENVRAFVDAQQRPAGNDDVPAVRSPAARTRASEAAGAELEKLGVTA